MDRGPEAVHTAEGTGLGAEEVGPIGEHWGKEALADAMEFKPPDAGTGEDSHLTKEKLAWASPSLCLKCWVGVRVWDSQ